MKNCTVPFQLFTLSLLSFTLITNNYYIDLCRCTNINGFWLISDASWNIQYLIFTSAKLCTILFNISPFSLLSITCLYMAPTNQILILEIKDKIFYIPNLCICLSEVQFYKNSNQSLYTFLILFKSLKTKEILQ